MRDQFLFVESGNEGKDTIELNELHMESEHRESLRLVAEDKKAGNFPELRFSEDDSEDERAYQELERRRAARAARRQGQTKVRPTPESYLEGVPPISSLTARAPYQVRQGSSRPGDAGAAVSTRPMGKHSTIFDGERSIPGLQDRSSPRDAGAAIPTRTMDKSDVKTSAIVGSTRKLPTCADDDRRGDRRQDQDAVEHTPLSNPLSSASRTGGSMRRERWRSRKTRSRLDMSTGRTFRCSVQSRGRAAKEFEDFTIGELKDIVETCTEKMSKEPENNFANFTRELPDIEDLSWMDDVHAPDIGKARIPKLREDDIRENGINLLDECSEQEKPTEELLNLSWRSDISEFGGRKFVRVESVMDLGASTPVAPPSMMPSVPIQPSEGSPRGQKWSSASKHKIRNLGEQRLKAVTEEGEETEVLFQIADVSKPLVSVSAICERGNRVIFGRAGGVVQNLASGKLIPFEHRNGIYILSLWLEDESESPFHRR